jgi:hypothetical protein
MGKYLTEKPRHMYLLEEGPSTVPHDTEEGYQTESSSALNGSSVSYSSYLITSDSQVWLCIVLVSLILSRLRQPKAHIQNMHSSDRDIETI